MKHLSTQEGTDYKPVKLNKLERKKLHEEMIKFRQALEQDYWDSLKRPSGLPKDWRNRIIKAVA